MRRHANSRRRLHRTSESVVFGKVTPVRRRTYRLLAVKCDRLGSAGYITAAELWVIMLRVSYSSINLTSAGYIAPLGT